MSTGVPGLAREVITAQTRSRRQRYLKVPATLSVVFLSQRLPKGAKRPKVARLYSLGRYANKIVALGEAG
jgi:hypothetical protein